MKEHMNNAGKNAKYTSPFIQNELINYCGVVIREKIVTLALKATAYSILADESADCSGKEQLSIGIRFCDENHNVREEFLGFIELKAMDASSIAKEIDEYIEIQGLDPKKCVGQGYDGASSMAGKDAGVQAIMQRKYSKALYIHCASHRLNLVVNDTNRIVEIRNAVETIKSIINFFRDSPLRRQYAPNIPLLSETRWSQKYKSIGLFKKKFREILEALEKLSYEGNPKTRPIAFQLLSAALAPAFIVSVFLIAKYSALLEPVVNALQSSTLHIIKCAEHIQSIITVVREHREDIDSFVGELFGEAVELAKYFDVEIKAPRICRRQAFRANPPAETALEYYKCALIIPYLDSFQSFLDKRFTKNNSPAFNITYLHPFNMLSLSMKDFKSKIEEVAKFYALEDLEKETEIWYAIWKNKNKSQEDLKLLEPAELVENAIPLFPATKKALEILLALPCTTCAIERSFSTLRKVKTWLRSTMGDDRLNGLCMLSVHRKFVAENQESIIVDTIDRFAENPRRLLFK